MSVREAQARIDAPEFAEWMAFERLEPFGPQRDDERAGTIAATLANINRDSAKKSDPFMPTDFFPRLEDMMAEAEAALYEPPADELQGKLMAWALLMADANKGKPKASKKPRKGKDAEGPSDQA